MNERPRFFAWFRMVPLLAMGVILALSLGVDLVPASVMRSTLYPVHHNVALEDSAARQGVDPYLAAAVIKCESNWNEDVQSSAGAVGLMQLMPDTAETIAGLGFVNTSLYSPSALTDPETNIEYGCAYLRYLGMQLSNRDEVIAAYNAGPGKVRDWLSGTSSGIVSDAIDYPETRFYLQRVNDAYEHYQELYPNGFSEG